MSDLIKIAIALGSNLGDRRCNVKRAAQLLGERAVDNVRLSPIHETAPVDCGDDAPDFVNAAVTGITSLSAEELFQECRRIEEELGRPAVRGYHADRTIDVDILLYDDEVVRSEDLTIPHPRMTERRFVLEPLAEIAPDWTIPAHGLRVDEALERLKDN